MNRPVGIGPRRRELTGPQHEAGRHDDDTVLAELRIRADGAIQGVSRQAG
jgi:hypothetical protein